MPPTQSIKNLLLPAFLLAGGSACTPSQPPPDCHRYRAGMFSFHIRHPRYGTSYLITRRGGIQTETDQQTGGVSKLAITWLDDCTYQLRLLETTEHFSKEVDEYRRSAPLTTTILAGTDRYYLFRAQRGTTGTVLTDTIWVVR